ncbi:MAG TPA: transaldolase family protein [Telluria sp.]
MSEASATLSPPAARATLVPQWWLDGLSREQLESGRLARLIADGLQGVSSNSAALLDEIGNCPAFHAVLPSLRAAHPGPQDRLDALLLPDVKRACDLFAATWEGSSGRAGFVCIDLPPFIAHDVAGIVAAGRRLHGAVARPNVVIKVPATPAGVQAIEQLVFEGIGVNATLACTPRRVAAVRAAHRRGLARRLQATMSVQRIACIASLPARSLDDAVDAQLGTSAAHLRGKAGAACARLAWRDLDSDSGFAVFAAFGAAPQQLALAGASDGAPLPGVVFIASADCCSPLHAAAVAQPHLQDDIDAAQATVAQLARHGIDLETIGNDALAAGLTEFGQTHRNLLALMG